MHKKLASDLTSLAHSILQMKNKDDVFALKEKAHEVYEKLALLAYVEEYINNTPNATVTKSDLIATITKAEAEKVEKNKKDDAITPVLIPLPKESNIETTDEIPVNTTSEELGNEKFIHDIIDINQENTLENTAEEIIVDENTTGIDTEPEVSTEKSSITNNSEIEEPIAVDINTVVENEVIEQPFDELENILFGDNSFKNEADFIENLKTPNTTTEESIIPEEDIKSAVTKTVEEEKEEVKEQKKPTLEEELKGTISVDIMANLFEKPSPKRTLNDRLQNSIQIDLNDRIAFVKNLFEGDQKDFNRVVSQLNTAKSEKEAKQFIVKMVKPDYDWSGKEQYETRLFEIIERRFA